MSVISKDAVAVTCKQSKLLAHIDKQEKLLY